MEELMNHFLYDCTQFSNFVSLKISGPPEAPRDTARCTGDWEAALVPSAGPCR